MDYLFNYHAKGLLDELTLSHIQSIWGFREDMVRTAKLAACYNYFFKKEKIFSITMVINWKKKK